MKCSYQELSGVSVALYLKMKNKKRIECPIKTGEYQKANNRNDIVCPVDMRDKIKTYLERFVNSTFIKKLILSFLPKINCDYYEEKIRDCPYCGGKPDKPQKCTYWMIACNHCDVVDIFGESKEEVIKKWNEGKGR